VGTAAVLAAIDLVYVPAGRISKMYLLDAALEVGWIWPGPWVNVPDLDATGNQPNPSRQPKAV
jgi:hypothetical protein